MSVYRVLEKLETYVHEGTWLPAGYRILSEERLIEFVEKVRSSLPEEVFAIGYWSMTWKK